MSTLQKVAGALLMGGILAFGVHGVVVELRAGDYAYVADDLYDEECGACHLAYPPGLLPPLSWERIMQGLEDHFGDNAELDEETAAHVAAYLARFALGRDAPSTMSQMLRNLPRDPPLRITELPAFIAAHTTVAERVNVDAYREGFMGACADCHPQAAEARFDDDLVAPDWPANLDDRARAPAP